MDKWIAIASETETVSAGLRLHLCKYCRHEWNHYYQLASNHNVLALETLSELNVYVASVVCLSFRLNFHKLELDAKVVLSFYNYNLVIVKVLNYGEIDH